MASRMHTQSSCSIYLGNVNSSLSYCISHTNRVGLGMHIIAHIYSAAYYKPRMGMYSIHPALRRQLAKGLKINKQAKGAPSHADW